MWLTFGLGDDIQSIKAGILEIADILVVNKADRPGADQSARYLRSMIQMGHGGSSTSAGKHSLLEFKENEETEDTSEEASYWIPPVVKTTATDNSGIPELVEQLQAHQHWLKETGNWERKSFHASGSPAQDHCPFMIKNLIKKSRKVSRRDA